MAPLDLGGVVEGAKGAAETAASGVGGAAKTAAGAVATATTAVKDAQGKFNDAKGMLGMFTKIQGYITKIQEAWDKYRYLIIFLVCFIIFIYISLTIYCCYHFIQDCFRCSCCCIKCTYKCEKYLWKHKSPLTKCLCKPCTGSTSSSGKSNGKKEKESYHKCSKLCLKTVPKSTRMELEKQHGDLRKGWFDSTYFFARSCGRFELPENPEERSKWHWYGHEDEKLHKFMKIFTRNDSNGNRLKRIRDQYKKNERYWEKLSNGIDKLGENAGNWKKRVPKKYLPVEDGIKEKA